MEARRALHGIRDRRKRQRKTAPLNAKGCGTRLQIPTNALSESGARLSVRHPPTEWFLIRVIFGETIDLNQALWRSIA